MLVADWASDERQEDKEDDHYESKRVIRLEKNGTPLQPGQVFVRFHHNTSTFLTVHPTQVAIHSASTPGKTSSWNVPSSATSKALTDAAFSSDGSHVYVTSSDGAVGIFRAPDLQPVCAVTLPEVRRLSLGLDTRHVNLQPPRELP